MSAAGKVAEPREQSRSAAAPSPFPPIADYAFLSNCHSGALVAPDGSIDWLVRHPASTRRASSAACSTGGQGPSDSGRSGSTTRPQRSICREPTFLETTWKTPSGWIVVRDALTMGPRSEHEDEITPHTRPPADDDADHLLVRTVSLPRRSGRSRARLRAGLRLRPSAHRMGAGRGGSGTRPTPAALAKRSASGSDLGARHRRRPRPGAARAQRGRSAPTAPSHGPNNCAAPLERGRRRAADRRDDALLARLAWRGAHPRPPMARPASALGPHHQGTDLHANRRNGGGADHVAARNPGRGAELGLSLHLDARCHLHVAGAALARAGLGGRRIHGVRRGRQAERRRRAADHVRDRWSTRTTGVDTR